MSETYNQSQKTGTTEFKAMVRYIAANEVVTIPKKVSRKIGLKLGDIVKIKIRIDR